MWVKRRHGWELPERLATPEKAFLNRRQLLASMGGAAAMAAIPSLLRAEPADPTGDLYPAGRNATYTVARSLTPEKISAAYNNFYEFGSHKQIHEAAQALQTRPWQIRIDGAVEKPVTIDIDALIRKMGIEERLYRHRCVEAWSMVVPWSGFPMKKLVDLARPLSAARYVRMETFLDPNTARGQRATWYPWPYVEGLTMAEASNDLAFLVTGAYGKPMAKQFGAPLRLAVPWKYGFKHIKSITRFRFTETRPKSFWEEVQGREYGFWANVNPAVDHPRWSQATERDIGSGIRVPTQIYNGYGEYVAGIYKGLENSEKLFM
jgi:methionine sulfoxide reductase catalytic subunit